MGLTEIARWHAENRGKARSNARPVFLLGEVHKLDRWSEQVKHVHDTFDCKMVLTGFSSVLVARGQRESLAGRATTTEFPPFLFREVLEAWHPRGLDALPPPIGFDALFDDFPIEKHFSSIHRQPPQRGHSWRRRLDRYYNRGGYPRLHSGDVPDDRWADYLVETVFERVLGADIPDLFPVDQASSVATHLPGDGSPHGQRGLAGWTRPGLHDRWVQDDTARRGSLPPLPGRRAPDPRVPALPPRPEPDRPRSRQDHSHGPGRPQRDLPGAPRLWESPPDVVGPLVETLVQGALRGKGLQVHFYRDHSKPGDRRSPIEEVDFVVEALDGTAIPVEVKFRTRVRLRDDSAVGRFMQRFDSPLGIVVTRNDFGWDPFERILLVPVLDFLLAF